MESKKKEKEINLRQVDLSLSFEETKRLSQLSQNQEGITLVALIITIIILVILAAVSINAVYNSKIVEFAINGTTKYGQEGINENKVLEGTESLIESAISNIKGIGEGTSSSTEPNPPEETELTKEELAKEEMIGKYVDYRPQGTDYTVEGQYSGTGSNQTFAKNDGMKWRIWGVEGDKLLLISETLAGNIQLEGADGYNNAVKILNDACSTAFGNSTTYGSGVITARSINQEDIDKVTNMTTDAQRKAAYSSYGSSYSPSNYQWPNIYGQEPGKTGGGSLNRSSQSSWVTGTTNSSFTGKNTYYFYDITNYATQTMYDALLTNMSASSTSGTDSYTTYWVASRCAYIGIAYFRIFRVNGSGSVGAYELYKSNGSTSSLTYAVRPVVEVNLDAVSIGGTGSGTNTDPYSIALK